MNKLQLFAEKTAPRILCLGAHSDDIEIGCGGTILKLADAYPRSDFKWVVFSGQGKRAEEALKSANSFLAGVKSKVIDILTFKDSYFPFVGGAVKDYFVKLKDFSPDLVLTHYSNDAHQDHQLIAKLTWNSFRNHLILEYEIAKYDGDLGTPNFYVHLDEDIIFRKVNTICKEFQSQHENEWFGEDAFRSIMRIRGLESNSPSKYAEAFYCRKIVV
jgi:LmbE family N-acetylglucosaminyl deacetylase